jgi:hypothetical protein
VEFAHRVADLRDEHNLPGQEMPGTGSHYDEVFDDGATEPKPMTRERRRRRCVIIFFPSFLRSLALSVMGTC